MIGVAKIHELLALLIDRQERDIPLVLRGGVLNFAGRLMRLDLLRHAKLCGERTPERDGDAAVSVSLTDGELRGWRGRHGNCNAQASGGGKLLQNDWIG